MAPGELAADSSRFHEQVRSYLEEFLSAVRERLLSGGQIASGRWSACWRVATWWPEFGRTKHSYVLHCGKLSLYHGLEVFGSHEMTSISAFFASRTKWEQENDSYYW